MHPMFCLHQNKKNRDINSLWMLIIECRTSSLMHSILQYIICKIYYEQYLASIVYK